MARYWVYLNEQVAGPYDLEQLIKVPGFSRRTLVCVDDYSGEPGQWISPANIPELSHIFRVAEELHDRPTPTPLPRPVPKPVRNRMPSRLTPVPPPVEEPRSSVGTWIWVLLFACVAGGALFHWNQLNEQRQLIQDRAEVRSLAENYRLPAGSQYNTLRQYYDDKKLNPTWEMEHLPTGLYNATVTASSGAGEDVPVFAFEANLQSQSLRGLNSAAIKLLNEGFVPPPSKAPKSAAAPPRHAMADLFPSALNDRRQAFEQGDFAAVWAAFSQRQQQEMERGGIGETGFARLQGLTRRLAPPITQTIVKTIKDGEKAMLVLVRQTQSKHPDLFIKQRWVVEGDQWKLDEEEKRTANAAAMQDAAENPAAPPASPIENPKNSFDEQKAPTASDPGSPSNTPPPKSAVMALPGISPGN